MQAALPSWAYLYGRLIMDAHRGVRCEASQVTTAMAAAVGRGIAPLLKALLPALWLAQYDGYADAAAAARGALAAAFPSPAKQRDAVLYCRAEVGSMIIPRGIALHAFLHPAPTLSLRTPVGDRGR